MSIAGKNIKALREQKGLTQQELADIAGVTRETVGKWESDMTNIRESNLARLREYFNLTIDDLSSEDAGLYAQKNASGLSERRPIRASTPARLPLRRLGRVHAGERDEEYADEGEVMVPADVALGHPNAFVLTVVGGCMDNEIPEGYDAVVDPDLRPRNGCVAVVEVVPGEAVMRRWTLAGRTLVLSCDSHTEEHDDIVLSARDEPRLVGVVVWSQKDMWSE